MDELTIRRPDDFHVHLRRGDMLRAVLPYTARHFGRALVMPNTDPPIWTGVEVGGYRQEIIHRRAVGTAFEPLMAIQLGNDTTPEQVRDAKRWGAVAGKLYPAGISFSERGVSLLERLYPAFEAMSEESMVLLLHGQFADDPDFPDIVDWEEAFLPILGNLTRHFPQLRIVMEHISTAKGVFSLRLLPDTVAATITAHHLLYTQNDLLAWSGLGGKPGLNPHHYCQPVLQKRIDRDTLRTVVTRRDPKFFFGSDSAPHLRERKEGCCGMPGVFSGPVILPVLATLFERLGALDRLEAFTSEYGARFYGLPLNTGTVTLVRKEWKVPAEIDGVVPLLAGETLAWKVREDE